MRWLIAVALSFAVAGPVDAGVFKARGKDTSKPAEPAKKPAAEKPATDKPATVAKKTPAKAAPTPAQKKEPVVAAKKAPVKKGRNSAVASNGRPDDLTPDPPKSKKGKSDLVITEDKPEKDEDDVIIRDIDD